MVDDRDGRRCVRCGRSLYAVGGSRHHRKLRSQCTRVEKHQVQNLILLCGSGTTGCHGFVHMHPTIAYENGWCVKSFQAHYKDGPFECIELSRLLSSDWGQAVQYCFRWQHKNGVEDLKKAFWFINDAITHNVPFFAACCKRNADILEAQAIRLLSILQAENWADLEQFWRNLKWGDRVDVLEALTEKINEIEKEGK